MRYYYFRSTAAKNNAEKPKSEENFFADNEKSRQPNGQFFNNNSSGFFTPVQAKSDLKVGEPGDKYEQEADRVADQVVRGLDNPQVQAKCADCEEEESVQKLNIQAKCAECEEEVQKQEEEEEEVMAKSESGQPAQGVSGESLASSKGAGNALPDSTRQEMESAFTRDFGDVRIHTGSAAERMSAQLHAQAFTHGSDIYFNKGKFDPDSRKGKELLAHELTHVVQQKHAPRIQRAVAPEFRVTGKFPGATRDADSVYFDFDSSAIDSAEEAKINTLSASTTQDYELVGFSSEEGGDIGNRNMTNSRLGAVDRKMRAKGHTGKRDKKNQFRRGTDRIDYRRLRRVDILPTGTPSTEPDCSVPPTVSCGTTFNKAYPIAISRVLSAYVIMEMAPFNPVEKPRVENAVAAMFGNVSHYNTVKGHLRNLLNQVIDQRNTARCHNSCDSTCSQADAYMDGATGPGAVLTLCEPFYAHNSLAYNVNTLIHEALHATTGLATQDLAYDSERGITFLDSATALRNTDSYVLFIRELLSPGSVLGGGGGSRDTIDSAITGTELADLRRVMAYLEKWIIESTAETSSLYDTIVEVIAAGTWAGASSSYYEDTMAFLAPIFGLKAPSTVPTETDQVAVAGIYDRLMRMDNLLWTTNIAINKDPGPVRFAAGPSDPLLVNDAFLSSGQHSMVYELVRKLVAANSSIGASEKPKYISLIEKIRVHAGHAAPAP